MTAIEIKNRPSKTKAAKFLTVSELNSPVQVTMLPSDAKSIIVNYSEASSIRITCVIPEKEREVKIKRGKSLVKLTTPPLMLSALYSDIPKPSLISGFYIWGYYPRDKKTLWAAPYIISNVFEDGRICFGTLEPKNLRAANNMFWDSPFNDEIAGAINILFSYDEQPELPQIDSYDIKKYIQNYREVVFDQQNWEDYTSIVCGKKFWAHSFPPRATADAVLVTNNKHLLKQIPKTYWRKQNNQALFIARAKKEKNFWVFDSGTVKFKLPLASVSTN